MSEAVVCHVDSSQSVVFMLKRHAAGTGRIDDNSTNCPNTGSSQGLVNRWRAGGEQVVNRCWAGGGQVGIRWWAGGGQVVNRWWTGGEHLENRYWTGGLQVVNMWWTGIEQVVNRWWTGGEQVVNRWWTGGEKVVNRWWICGEQVMRGGGLMENLWRRFALWTGGELGNQFWEGDANKIDDKAVWQI